MITTALETLAECELLYHHNHGNKEKEFTKVVVFRMAPFRSDEPVKLYDSLSSYGNLLTFSISNRNTTIGSICEVTYPYLTQAYLAYLMANGKKSDRGCMKAVIEKTEKNSEILKEAVDNSIYLHQCYFPKLEIL